MDVAERAIIVAPRAPEEDFRNWVATDAWAAEIAGEIWARHHRSVFASH